MKLEKLGKILGAIGMLILLLRIITSYPDIILVIGFIIIVIGAFMWYGKKMLK